MKARLVVTAIAAVSAAALLTLGGERQVLPLALAGAFAGALAFAAIFDLQERRIPNALTYGGTAAALLVAGMAGPREAALALSGATLAGGVMLAVWFAGRGRLGLGDVKLVVFGGAVLGPQGLPVLLLGGTMLGGVAALFLLARGYGRRATFAYGPYLALGALLALIVNGTVLG